MQGLSSCVSAGSRDMWRQARREEVKEKYFGVQGSKTLEVLDPVLVVIRSHSFCHSSVRAAG